MRFPGDSVSDGKSSRRRGPLATAIALFVAALALFAAGTATAADIKGTTSTVTLAVPDMH